jgi:hypothetical protein
METMGPAGLNGGDERETMCGKYEVPGEVVWCEAVERGMFSSDESGVDALECGGEVV